MKHHQVFKKFLFAAFLPVLGIFCCSERAAAINAECVDAPAQGPPCNVRVDITSVREAPLRPGVTPLPVGDEFGRQIVSTRWEVRWQLASPLPPCTEVREYRVALSNSTGTGDATVAGNVTSAIVFTRRIVGQSITRIASTVVTGTARTRVFGEAFFRNASIGTTNDPCNLIPISITTNLASASLETVRSTSSAPTVGDAVQTGPTLNLGKLGLTVSWTASLPTQPPLCVKIDGFTVFVRIRLTSGVTREGSVNVPAGATSATVLLGDASSIQPGDQRFSPNRLDRIEEVRVRARVSPDISIQGTEFVR